MVFSSPPSTYLLNECKKINASELMLHKKDPPTVLKEEMSRGVVDNQGK